MMIQITSLVLMLIIFIIINVILHFISYEVVVWIALAALAVPLTDIFIKFIWEIIPMPKLSDLKNKVVLITGCGTGFGYQLAKQLDAKGVTVYAGYRRVDCAGASQLKQACSDKLVLLQMDITREEEVVAAYQKVKKELQGKSLAAVVNNAGVIWPGEAEYTPMESYQRTMAVNGIGTARVTQTFLPLLRQSKGRVVFTEGICSYLGIPFLSSYSMARHAAKAYLEALRREMFRFGVSVHIVEPFLYRTAIANEEVLFQNLLNDWNHVPEEVREAYGGEIYLTHAKKFMSWLLGTGKSHSKAYEVANCLEDAAIGKFPKSRYVPGFTGKLLTWLALNVPVSLLDLICLVLEHIFIERGLKKTR